MNEKTSRASTMGFDDFMKYEGAKGGGGGFFAGWKKNEQGPNKTGQVSVFLHRSAWATAFWIHNWPRMVETEDKETKDKVMSVFGQRWGCHEREIVNQKQHFRDKGTKHRDYPVEVCPVCKLVDQVAVLYLTGKIPLTMPLFAFEGTTDSVVLTAGGLIGRYGAKELTPAETRAMRLARVDRSEAYKEDMRSKLKYLYLVVDAAHPEEGVQKAFEGQAITSAIKKAVTDTRTRLGKKGRGEYANPAEYPYPFEWCFDDSKEFSDKFSVIALQEDSGTYAVSDDVMKLITAEAPDISRDIATGDCFELRGQMEAHVCPEARAFIDFDAIFGEAKKRGLMVASQESKADEGEEDEDPAALAGRVEPERSEVVVIDAQHAAWNDPKWKPGPEIKRGVEVHTDAPESTTDEERARVEELIAKTGATVGQMVFCDHCKEVITTLDPECIDCGARYGEDGLITSRPCMKPECEGQVVLTTPGPETIGRGMICEKCGTIHEATASDAGVVWAIQPPDPEEVKAVPKPAAGRRRPAPVAPSGASSKVPFG